MTYTSDFAADDTLCHFLHHRRPQHANRNTAPSRSGSRQASPQLDSLLDLLFAKCDYEHILRVLRQWAIQIDLLTYFVYIFVCTSKFRAQNLLFIAAFSDWRSTRHCHVTYW